MQSVSFRNVILCYLVSMLVLQNIKIGIVYTVHYQKQTVKLFYNYY